ncbi:methylase involved in ubiquinone/menaquinone biosynthesis [Rivularia sp. PCC 7116]|uniref:class I SAM-dependent methyltransferase n=1 Tax=Rivularia sp. PCC 7116 TaxID=373994 RepID=UPI00029F1572|nr:class I SAM-dependent methyltransferase [Rivularia sp. PCC 7116]AFY58475.1 methylase involved in ubiquinone/menaquinone biosynthesis [Rivularia sp. PCC 7116]
MKAVFEAESTVKQWDEDYYHPIALKFYDWAIIDMLKMMEVEPGATVLDAGCGPGVHSIRVAKAGYRVCAIDISNTMLSEAQQRAKAENVADKIEFYQKDLTKLDFPDNSFNYVFSWGVIIHIRDVEKALNELARIVKPGGKLALYITNKTAVDHNIESLMRFIARKPLTDLQHLQLGDGVLYNMNDEKIWLWRFEKTAIAEYLATKKLNLKHCHIGELSEIQRRLTSVPRNCLLQLNNLAYRWNLPTNLATTQLLIFEKA